MEDAKVQKETLLGPFLDQVVFISNQLEQKAQHLNELEHAGQRFEFAFSSRFRERTGKEKSSQNSSLDFTEPALLGAMYQGDLLR